MVREAKKDRAVILTTHSMEEAEVRKGFSFFSVLKRFTCRQDAEFLPDAAHTTHSMEEAEVRKGPLSAC